MSQLSILPVDAVPQSSAYYLWSAADDPPECTRPFFYMPIPAGFPSPAADYVENGLDLNKHLIRNRATTFFFLVRGDSMDRANIHDGDTVIVDRSINPQHGHCVLAVVNDDFTIKRLYQKNGVIELRPENPAFKTIQFVDGEELQVWGVIVGSIRRFFS